MFFCVAASVKCFICVIAFYPHIRVRKVVITPLLEMRKLRLGEAWGHAEAIPARKHRNCVCLTLCRPSTNCDLS